ncbi:MAG: hypothetical protein K1X66_03115 [Verrucomicrobiae bacterium]|nr:hypothetical protein [Verrucomicrobiae bacterium]
MKRRIGVEFLFLRQTFKAILQIESPPVFWRLIIGFIFPAWLLACGTLYFWGEAQGNYSKYFEENMPGTFLSTALLLASSLICSVIARSLIPQNRKKIFTFFVVIQILGMLVIGSIYTFDLIDSPDQKIYSFHDGRIGEVILWIFWSLLLGLMFIMWPMSSSFARFWLLMSLLLGFAGLDDLLMFHERIAKMISNFLHLPKGQNYWLRIHMNDILALAYAPVAALVWFRYRRDVARLCWMLRTLALASIFFLGSSYFDFGHAGAFREESLKIGTGALILGSFLIAYHEIKLLKIADR